MRYVINFSRCGCVKGTGHHGRIAAVGEKKRVLLLKARRLKQILMNAEIVQFGQRSLLRLANGSGAASDDYAGLAATVIHVAGQDCLRRADDDAGRLQILFDAMRAEIALGGGVAIGVDVKSIVGTGLHATLAADTAAIIEVYDSIRTAEERVGGTNLDAGGVVAVVTSHHAKMALAVRELAGLHVFDPSSKDSDRDLVLLFARYGTGVTANTSILVDDEPVAHKRTYCTEAAGSMRSGVVRKLVAQTVSSWNHIVHSLQQIDLLRREGLFRAA